MMMMRKRRDTGGGSGVDCGQPIADPCYQATNYKQKSVKEHKGQQLGEGLESI